VRRHLRERVPPSILPNGVFTRASCSTYQNHLPSTSFHRLSPGTFIGLSENPGINHVSVAGDHPRLALVKLSV